MKRLLLVASIALALSPALAFASPAPAGQGSDQHWSPQHRDDRGRHDRDNHDRGRHDRDHRPVVVIHNNGRHDNGRHEGWYKQSWRRGQRVPVVYLQPRYYVNDYRAYGLAPPPRGYRWVRPYPDSSDYLLVAVATGLIAQVLGY